MSRQLRKHIRTQLRVLLEEKEKKGWVKSAKSDRNFIPGDLENFDWRDALADKPRDLSLKNVMKGIKDEEDIKEIEENPALKAQREKTNKAEMDALKAKEAKAKEDLAQAKNMEEAELSPKQKKIAQAAPPPDKITGADFAALKSKKKLKEYINEMIPSLLEADEEEGQEDDAFVPNHYKPEFIPREAEQALEKLGLTPIDRYVDFVNFMNSVPKSLKVVLTNGNSFLLYFDEDGLRLQIGANEIDISDDRTLPEAQDMINDLLMGPTDVPEEEEEAAEEVPAEEEPAAEEEPTEEEPAEEA